MLQKAFKHDGPAVIEAVVHRQELSMPPDNYFGTSYGLSGVHAQICPETKLSI